MITRRAVLAGGLATILGGSLSAQAVAGTPRRILGDSYTQGVGATTYTRGWAYLANADLGWGAAVDGKGGSGYCRNPAYNPGTFETRLWALPSAGPDLLVLQGSSNDVTYDPTDIATALNRVMRLVPRRWPNTEVLVMGICNPYGPGDDLRRVNDKVRAAARFYGHDFIDPIDWFVKGDGARYANNTVGDPGKGHPNDAGHRLIADQFVAAVRAL